LVLTTEERLSRAEGNLQRLAASQDQMMDLLGLTMEGEQRLATRMERVEEAHERFRREQEAAESRGEAEMGKISQTVATIDDQMTAVIGVVEGLIRRQQ